MADGEPAPSKGYRFSLFQLISVFVFLTLMTGIPVIQYQNRLKQAKLVVENVRLRTELAELSRLLEESENQHSSLSIAEKLLHQLIQDPARNAKAIAFLKSRPVGSFECTTHSLPGLANRSFCKYYEPIDNFQGWWTEPAACFLVQEEPFKIVDTIVEGHARIPEKRDDEYFIIVVRPDKQEVNFRISESGFQLSQ